MLGLQEVLTWLNECVVASTGCGRGEEGREADRARGPCAHSLRSEPGERLAHGVGVSVEQLWGCQAGGGGATAASRASEPRGRGVGGTPALCVCVCWGDLAEALPRVCPGPPSPARSPCSLLGTWESRGQAE